MSCTSNTTSPSNHRISTPAADLTLGRECACEAPYASEQLKSTPHEVPQSLHYGGKAKNGSKREILFGRRCGDSALTSSVILNLVNRGDIEYNFQKTEQAFHDTRPL
jgi:hypothetical protein